MMNAVARGGGRGQRRGDQATAALHQPHVAAGTGKREAPAGIGETLRGWQAALADSPEDQGALSSSAKRAVQQAGVSAAE
jgi:hypothetical protein